MISVRKDINAHIFFLYHHPANTVKIFIMEILINFATLRRILSLLSIPEIKQEI